MQITLSGLIITDCFYANKQFLKFNKIEKKTIYKK